MSTDTESAIRRRAQSRGYGVVKSRRAYSIDNLGEYMLVEHRTNGVALGVRYDATLEDIAAFLQDIEPERLPNWRR